MKPKHTEDQEAPPLKPVKGVEHDLCKACHRQPSKVNNEQSECSHVDCPHRRTASSLDDYEPHKVQRRGENPKSKHLVSDGWGSGCYKKRARFED